MPKVARDRAEEAIRASAGEPGISAAVMDKMITGLKPSIRLLPSPGSKPPIGGTRAGGRPDLPDGVEWPVTEETGEPMPFILQVNLADAAPFDVEGVLPKTGLLSFFFFTEDEDSGEDGIVLYFPELTGLKKQARWPKDLPEETRYRDVPLAARVEWTLPDRSGLSNRYLEGFFDVLRRVEQAQGIDAGQGDSFQLLGNPQFVQSYDLRKGQSLLLQISPDYSDEGDGCTGMAWGDGGSVYFIMKTADLKAAAFDQVSVILDMC
jgi:uncharacterized protein YwqG